MRPLHPMALLALEEGRAALRCLVKVTQDPPDPPFCIWDDVGSIVYGADTYHGAAGRFTVSPSVSAKDRAVRNLDLVLSGLDQAALAIVATSQWHQRPILVQRSILSPDTWAFIDLLPEFSGFLDTVKILDAPGGDATLTFRCESASRAFDRGNARTRSEADQRLRDASDGLFGFAATAINTPIEWGSLPPEKVKKPKSPFKAMRDKVF